MDRTNRVALDLLRVAVAALTAANVVDSLEPVLTAFFAAMNAELAALYRHDVVGMSWPVLVVPREARNRLPATALAVPTPIGARLHPGWAHCMTGRPRPFAVTDLMPARAWHASPAGRMTAPLLGDRNYQFAVPIYPPDRPTTFWAWVVGRSATDFTHHERDVATLVRPILHRVTLHLAALDDMGSGAADDFGVLTRREVVVLRLLSHELTAVQIGDRLGISARTVHKHEQNAFRKLGVHDRFHAVAAASHLGLLT